MALVHSDIAGNAGSNPAVYVGAATLAGICFDTFKSQIETMEGAHIPTVTDKFYAKLLTAGTAGGAGAKNINFTLRQLDINGPISLVAMGGIVLEVEFGAAEKVDDSKYLETPITKIEMLIKNICVGVTIESEKILISASSATFIPVIPSHAESKFDETCFHLNIDPVEASRVEGMIAYSGIQTIVSSMLRDRYEISLTELFPGVILLGQISANVIGANEAILIIPDSGLQMQPGSLCECADSFDGIGETMPGSTTSEGKITIGGPTAPVDGAVKLGRTAKGIGDTGLYMPLGLADIITAGPPPITRTNIGQSGFLGWDAQAVVDWKYRTTWFDVARGAIMVRWTARHGAAFVDGNLWVDLGKLGKIDAGSFRAKQQPSASTFTVALFPDENAGVATLHPAVEAIDMGDFFIEPDFKDFALLPFKGEAGFIEYIAKFIIYDLVSTNIPIQLTRSLRQYFATISWKILDVGYWGILTKAAAPNKPNPNVLWDATDKAIIISGRFDD